MGSESFPAGTCLAPAAVSPFEPAGSDPVNLSLKTHSAPLITIRTTAEITAGNARLRDFLPAVARPPAASVDSIESADVEACSSVGSHNTPRRGAGVTSEARAAIELGATGEAKSVVLSPQCGQVTPEPMPCAGNSMYAPHFWHGHFRYFVSLMRVGRLVCHAAGRLIVALAVME